MTKRALQPGDNVIVYGRPSPGCGIGPWAGKVVEQDNKTPHEGDSISVRAEFSNTVFDIHPKQCRRLKPKPQRERGERLVRYISGIAGRSAYVCHHKSTGVAEPIRLIECSESEAVVSREELARAWRKIFHYTLDHNENDAKQSEFPAFCKALGLPEAKS